MSNETVDSSSTGQPQISPEETAFRDALQKQDILSSLNNGVAYEKKHLEGF